MKTKTILSGCVIGLGMTLTTWAETFVDLSTPNEEIEKQLSLPDNFTDSSLESKGWGEEGKGFDEIVNDMLLSDFNDMPKVAMQVHFPVDSAIIQSNDEEVLRKLAIVFQGEKLSTAKIVVAGHTDSDGSNMYNTGLSYKRAESVKKFLISQGVSQNHLAIKAFGEEQPIASNADGAGKARNRRVEFIRMK
jgi:outer membrane protein OmpA-like peptidoglycan-associated protein